MQQIHKEITVLKNSVKTVHCPIILSEMNKKYNKLVEQLNKK